MDETPREIEAHIERTRERLGSNLRELEDRVDAATDWREHYRETPGLFLGAAFVGGVMLASALRPRSPRAVDGPEHIVRRLAVNDGPIRAQVTDFWNNLAAALIGVTGSRVRNYIDDFVPGFDDQFRRAQRRAGAFDPALIDLERSAG